MKVQGITAEDSCIFHSRISRVRISRPWPSTVSDSLGSADTIAEQSQSISLIIDTGVKVILQSKSDVERRAFPARFPPRDEERYRSLALGINLSDIARQLRLSGDESERKKGEISTVSNKIAPRDKHRGNKRLRIILESEDPSAAFARAV